MDASAGYGNWEARRTHGESLPAEASLKAAMSGLHLPWMLGSTESFAGNE